MFLKRILTPRSLLTVRRQCQIVAVSKIKTQRKLICHFRHFENQKTYLLSDGPAAEFKFSCIWLTPPPPPPVDDEGIMADWKGLQLTND